jgi:threonine synthase
MIEPARVRAFEPAVLRELLLTSVSRFDHPDVMPLQLLDGLNVLELFLGPTLAFKDVALQFLGNLFDGRCRTGVHFGARDLTAHFCRDQ